jgi:hypothetical protein
MLKMMKKNQLLIFLYLDYKITNKVINNKILTVYLIYNKIKYLIILINNKKLKHWRDKKKKIKINK